MCFICVCVRTDLKYYFYFCKTGCLLPLRTVPTNTKVYDYAGKAGLLRPALRIVKTMAIEIQKENWGLPRIFFFFRDKH